MPNKYGDWFGASSYLPTKLVMRDLYWLVSIKRMVRLAVHNFFRSHKQFIGLVSAFSSPSAGTQLCVDVVFLVEFGH